MTKPDPLFRPEPPPLSRLSDADIAALSKPALSELTVSGFTVSGPTVSRQREARWRPGLADQPLHSEIFADARDASGAGLALALACDALSVSGAVAEGQGQDALAEVEDRRQILWVQDKRAVELSGRPYIHGLPEEWRERVICVEAGKPEDALFALEEGLKCRDLACVIGEIAGNPRALDFTASRRLSLTAEKHGVALWLVRIEAEADLSSARMRWRAQASASSEPCWNAKGPGVPTWQAELFRARSHTPGEWKLTSKDGRLCVPKRSPKPPERPLEHSPDVPLFLPKSPPHRSPYKPSHNGNLVRATFGRSLAAVSRG